MKVLVIGLESEFEELKAKLGENNTMIHAGDHSALNSDIDFDCVFDFLVGESPEDFEIYYSFSKLKIFVNSVKTTLQELLYFGDHEFNNSLFGFNGLPTFINRDILEVSVQDNSEIDLLNKTCIDLGTDYELVKDRVGMVTPRIIFMIINEAFYTVQEGTATKEDIDLGMKLGTNYPYGPFEWCEKIGIAHVYETLEALYEDTKEERYKICPLLKSEYLKA